MRRALCRSMQSALVSLVWCVSFARRGLRGKGAPGQAGRAFAEAFQLFEGRANTLAVRARALALRDNSTTVAARQAVTGRGDFWGFDPHSPEVGRACAHQYLTRRGCLSAMSAANVASSAAPTSSRVPQRSRRTRRPPQHEPRPGTACRASQTPQQSGEPRTHAVSVKRTTQSRHAFHPLRLAPKVERPAVSDRT